MILNSNKKIIICRKNIWVHFTVILLLIYKLINKIFSLYNGEYKFTYPVDNELSIEQIVLWLIILHFLIFVYNSWNYKSLWYFTMLFSNDSKNINDIKCVL